MSRRKYVKPRYRRPRKGAAKTEAGKARSLQTAWRYATDRKGTLPMSEARKIVANPPVCPYCKVSIHWKAISIDHAQPRSRGGPSTPANLVYSCGECNRAKSDLTAQEFTALLAFLDGWQDMRKSVLMRLRAAGRTYRGMR